jgi:hypothetical protein
MDWSMHVSRSFLCFDPCFDLATGIKFEIITMSAPNMRVFAEMGSQKCSCCWSSPRRKGKPRRFYCERIHGCCGRFIRGLHSSLNLCIVPRNGTDRQFGEPFALVRADLLEMASVSMVVKRLCIRSEMAFPASVSTLQFSHSEQTAWDPSF